MTQPELPFTKKMSDLARAKDYLYKSSATATPDRVKEILGLKISHATLGRKFREAAAKGELERSYYTDERGEEIAHYRAPARELGDLLKAEEADYREDK